MIEYAQRKQEANERYLEAIEDDEETMSLLRSVANLSDITPKELIENVGVDEIKALIDSVVGIDWGDWTNTNEELQTEVEELKEENTSLQQSLITAGDLAPAGDLTTELEAMTEERDTLLVQLAEQLIENSEQRVDPAKIVMGFGDALKKAVRGMTGSID